MAVPKKRSSKSRKRSGIAEWKVAVPALRPCPNCGALGYSHFACKNCGLYKGREVIKLEIEKKKTKKEA